MGTSTQGYYELNYEPWCSNTFSHDKTLIPQNPAWSPVSPRQYPHISSLGTLLQASDYTRTIDCQPNTPCIDILDQR
jgi:hypothetical protein